VEEKANLVAKVDLNEINKELASSVVKNDQQCNEFKLAVGETWKDFRSKYPKSRPDWNNQVKMCARWHINGICFDICPRTISHVPCSKVPPKQKKEFPHIHGRMQGMCHS
jgi:hypothetical protein